LTGPIVNVPTLPVHAAPAQAVAKQRLIQTIQNETRRAMQQVIAGMPKFGSMSDNHRDIVSKHMQHTIRTLMQNLVAQEQIGAFQVGDVTVDGHQPFYEVNTLPPDTNPGDPYITVNEEGEEQYQGLVIACDGMGWGMILSEGCEGTGTGAIQATVTVTPQFPINYVTIDVKCEQ
jgi:hypothetical protein